MGINPDIVFNIKKSDNSELTNSYLNESTPLSDRARYINQRIVQLFT